MKPLRFCMVTTFYPPAGFGGDAIAVQNLSRALTAEGHAVTVVHNLDAFRLLAENSGALVETRANGASLGADGVEVVALSSGMPLLSSLLAHQTGRPVLKRAALKRVLDRDFDVIHFHNVSLIGGPGVLGLGSGVKLYSAHEHWLICGMHVLWKNNKEPCTSRACVRCTLRAKRPPQLWRYTGALRRAGANIDAFLAMSEFSREKHREFGHPYDMTVLPPLVPDAPRSGAASPHTRPYFLFSGRLETIKGLADVIPLFAEAETVPGVDLLIAGIGTQSAALTQLANGNPRVRFLGRIDPAELPRYYQHALATVVPSIGYETLGLAIIESFRAGTPVVARRIGPFPELVEAATGGVLFSSPEELRSALTDLALDATERARMGASARAAFLARWETSAALPRYMALVEQLLQRRHAINAARSGSSMTAASTLDRVESVDTAATGLA